MRAIALASAVTAFVLPAAAFAHQEEVYRIGDKDYMMVIGSINEPVIVDDKSGVELRVALVPRDGHEEAEHSHSGGDNAVTGLESTLKVELIAGDAKRTLNFSPIFGEAGAYKAVFIPTVQTTLTYRVFGTINNIPVDLSFTCNPAGHPRAPEDTTETPMGANVTRLSKTGAFGCPEAKEDMGFPEPAATLVSLGNTDAGPNWGIVGTVLGALGFVAGTAAWKRRS